ncbi:tol-pal system-associated acyl-CoA thioesterase [Burkholderiales bacterium JOSHI_001]|nr:tol-pal system-associated acyl-CoA thioesterase [Burkholderiales bacterium JOSHI_001]
MAAKGLVYSAAAPMQPPVPSPAPFVLTVRVYWEDTDAGGIVFYANHLKFFERARTEWLRALGIHQQALKEESGGIFVVQEARLRYLAPARLDDLLQVHVGVAEKGRASLLLGQQAWRNGTLLADGQVRIAFVDAGTLRPRRIPSPLLAALAS